MKMVQNLCLLWEELLYKMSDIVKAYKKEINENEQLSFI